MFTPLRPPPALPTCSLTVLLTLLGSSSLAGDRDWAYPIQPGDTLWGIAREHLGSVASVPALQKLNRIRDPYTLPVGATLRIPLQLMRQHGSRAMVSDLVGDASLDGEALASGQQRTLRPGAVLLTGRHSMLRLILEDGSVLDIGPGSRLVVNQASYYPSTGASQTGFGLTGGSVDSQISKNPLLPNRHHIQTPSAITAVRGTRFRVHVEDASQSSTEVSEGQVEVSTAQGRQALQAGYGSVTRQGQAPASGEPLPPAPALGGLPTLYQYSPPPLQWPAADGAAAYRASLQRLAPQRSLQDEQTLAQTRWWPMLADGDYQLTLRSQRENGLQGLPAKHVFRLHAQPAPPLVVWPVPQARLRGRTLRFHFSGDHDSRYRIELARDADFSTEVTQWQAGPHDASRSLPADGRWFWRVARLDQHGQAGPYSQVYTLHAGVGLWQATPWRGLHLSARPYPLPEARYLLSLQLLDRAVPAQHYSSPQPQWQDAEAPYRGRYRVRYRVRTPQGYDATELDDILLLD